MNKINMENTTNCFTLSAFDDDTIKVKVNFKCIEKNNCYYIVFHTLFHLNYLLILKELTL